MARVNTEKMEKVIGRDGKEYAFSKVRKIDGEYVVKVYINGEYSEDDTYYTDDKEDAINTRFDMITRFASDKDFYKFIYGYESNCLGGDDKPLF